MVVRVTTYALHGVESRRVTVEVEAAGGGLPALQIVGLGDRSVREARERVRAAVTNSGFKFPPGRVLVNLAPAHLPKEGPGFDLAIALGILAAREEIDAALLDRTAVYGELSIGGQLRPCRGALAVAEGALRDGFASLVVPAGIGGEAALVEGLDVFDAADLLEATVALRGTFDPVVAPDEGDVAPPALPDLQDVRGHARALRAITIAAAGGHNLLLSGPPGTGKTMLARRLPSVLPPLALPEAVEVTRIQSVAGLRLGGGLVRERPFRAPHHSISASGLVGGGAVPTPGEASMAHHGVLFLDELAEFQRPALEALRQPLEDGRVAIVRGQRTAIYPTRFMLVASTNPCPCGYAGSDRCRCGDTDVARYRRRLSGPLLDRLDLLVDVQRPSPQALAAPALSCSADVRAQVVAARQRATRRLAGTPVMCNAHLEAAQVRRHVALVPAATTVLRRAYERGTLSPRGHDRVLRVARTIADLAASDQVHPEHVVEAITFRQDAEADVPAQVGA